MSPRKISTRESRNWFWIINFFFRSNEELSVVTRNQEVASTLHSRGIGRCFSGDDYFTEMRGKFTDIESIILNFNFVISRHYRGAKYLRRNLKNFMRWSFLLHLDKQWRIISQIVYYLEFKFMCIDYLIIISRIFSNVIKFS